MTQDLIKIGFNKHGEADFSISGMMQELSFKEMTELRAMIPVAIGVAENMWRREQEKQNPPSQSTQ